MNALKAAFLLVGAGLFIAPVAESAPLKAKQVLGVLNERFPTIEPVACGSRGGPGGREANGKCSSWGKRRK
jgi:hypothetical protein